MPGIRIAIDRGGTFTDCVGNPGSGRMEDDIIIKLLSVDPVHYNDAPLEGIRRIVSHFTGKQIARTDLLDTSAIESIRMGTTVATNALLERKGERIALVVTAGFRDVLEIGNQSRPNIFDLAIRKPDVLHQTVIEIDERVTLEDYAEDPSRGLTDAAAFPDADPAAELVKGLSGETVRILKRPDPTEIERQLRELYAQGYRSIAVSLMHSYTFPRHEAIVGELAAKVGFEHVSLSHELMPMIKLVPRTTSVSADAYLTPAIKRYIAGFSSGFTGALGAVLSEKSDDTRCEFMQSDGGLANVNSFSGLRAILSGPAGGVVGYSRTCYDPATDIPVIGFDMGGTSTDVSRYGSGRFEHVFETTTAGVTIQAPQLDINTVAAGGGSRLKFKNGLFAVGPESAGAHPGPACYRKGGPLTITDANLYLGRLLPHFFPSIFGPDENEGLDVEASARLFEQLTDEINSTLDTPMTVDQVAYGFIKVANETMTRPIRTLTEARGHDTSKHRLATFGGAGGQHAVAIADALGISQILIHKYSSVLSAYGMALADVVDEQQEPESVRWGDDLATRSRLQVKLSALRDTSRTRLAQQGFTDEQIEYEEYLHMRYQGTESALMVIRQADDGWWDFGAAFTAHHQHEFGFTLPGREIVIDDIRVRAIGKTSRLAYPTIDEQLAGIERTKIEPPSPLSSTVSPSDRHVDVQQVYFEQAGGRVPTAVYTLKSLKVGECVCGPAMLADGTQTIVIPPHSTGLVTETHVVIDVVKQKPAHDSAVDRPEQLRSDPVLLSVFAHRFMAIAEQMGRALQKTSVSTNVKERLDYSCALFDVDGGLVANAPHLPVHLGSMSTCVRKQAAIWKGKLKRGDVLVSNHPMYGGTHLPDITVITPAFVEDEIVFYVASRAHHADIGGILPGSMPPHSRELFQEGAAIKSEKLVSEGRFNEDRLVELLYTEPAKPAGCSGTRCLSDNLNDLKAQVAANQKGISLISQLVGEYGLDVVHFYMREIQVNAEESVRTLLKQVSGRFQGRDLSAIDYMDDGSPIQLKVTIDGESGEAVFDFAGTGPQVYGNTNAPEAITYSAIIYCLRTLISEDIPLNQGCLKPVKVIIPPGSFLSPGEGAAVVGGNVLTSQRITDVVLRAFNACAASQGDCNNLTFGYGGNVSGQTAVAGFGYYETIAGGSGAGPTWNGTSGVHTHMTNTRITDPEIFERRYPVILRQFSLRPGSGGAGQHSGGDGVIRDIEFRIPVQVSILSERRVFRPYGLEGGYDGQVGKNIWIRHLPPSDCTDESDSPPSGPTTINLGGKNTASMNPGDRIIIMTPGGGGWGPPGKCPATISSQSDPTAGWKKGSVASRLEMAETSV